MLVIENCLYYEMYIVIDGVWYEFGLIVGIG